MRKPLAVLAALGLTIGAALTMAGPAMAAPAAWDCPGGYICAYTGTNGTGSRCAWDTSDPDWTSGSIRCSWAKPSRTVGSVYATTGSGGARLYQNANYSMEVDCVGNGKKASYLKNLQVLSHKRIPASCEI
ncbi:peptidase inhibitor family I36 protein [Streptomyces acidicola]|uniref:Peptidase inhibitor n=1 Tax=Streptomyces acidicola TaxID=2596892 RepID=A0A5N8WQ91_9ACTN|nr:peptidase inhibitor family I36 protein [Streptomyces acidicola]MPY49591.1 hypothetical protein [Streptomyces acidicola]